MLGQTAQQETSVSIKALLIYTDFFNYSDCRRWVDMQQTPNAVMMIYYLCCLTNRDVTALWGAWQRSSVCAHSACPQWGGGVKTPVWQKHRFKRLKRSLNCSSCCWNLRGTDSIIHAAIVLPPQWSKCFWNDAAYVKGSPLFYTEKDSTVLQWLWKCESPGL